MPKRIEPRTNVVTVRLSDSEHEKLRKLAYAARKDMSEVLRNHLAKQPPLTPAPPPTPVFDAQALKALAQIGNNLNQIARELHSRVRLGVEPKEFEQLDRALLAVIRMTLAGREKAQETLHLGISRVLTTHVAPTLEERT